MEITVPLKAAKINLPQGGHFKAASQGYAEENINLGKNVVSVKTVFWNTKYTKLHKVRHGFRKGAAPVNAVKTVSRRGAGNAGKYLNFGCQTFRTPRSAMMYLHKMFCEESEQNICQIG